MFLQRNKNIIAIFLELKILSGTMDYEAGISSYPGEIQYVEIAAQV